MSANRISSSQLTPAVGSLADGNVGHGQIAQAKREAGFRDLQAAVGCHALGKAGGRVQLSLLMLRAVGMLETSKSSLS